MPWVTRYALTATPTRDPLTPSPTPTATPTPIPPTCTGRPDQPTLTPRPTLLPTSTPGPTQPAVFPGGASSPHDVSGQPGYDILAEIALDGNGRGHIVWGWWLEDQWDQGQSYYIGQSAVGGWTKRVLLAERVAKNKGMPSLAVGPDGTLYAAYGDGFPSTQVAVHLKTSQDDGLTWSAGEQIAGAGTAYPTIRVDGSGLVHVLYRVQECNGDPDDEGTVCRYHQEYIEGRPGGAWSAPMRPLGGGEAQLFQDILCVTLPGGTQRTFLFIASQYDGLYALYKDGAGGSWSYPAKLGSTPGKSAQSPHAISFYHQGTQFVYVFWEVYARSGIEAAWSSDGGASWHYQQVTELTEANDVPHIASAAPVYDYVNEQLWVLYVHVEWTPRRGYIGVIGVTPGQGDWYPHVPGPDEVVVLEADSQQSRSVVLGWREGSFTFPVAWEEHIRWPYGAPDIEVYQAWVIPSEFPNLWADR